MSLAPSPPSQFGAQLPSGAPPPAVVPFGQWYNERARQPGQGRHQLFDGPTQSGKTVACRILARQRSFVVVLGTKPVDESLDAYVNEGYTRIDHWPPTNADYRKGQWTAEEARFILWPKIKERKQLRAFAPVYAKCLDEVFIDGKWTVVADEGLWLCSRTGLNLGQQVADIAYGSASNKVSLYLCIQRPAGLPRVAWSSCSDVLQFHAGVTNDIRELASLGTYDPKDVARVIKGLGQYQFLDLPCRGGAEWVVSKVEM